GDGVPALQQAGDEQVAVGGVAEDDARAELGRDQGGAVAGLLGGDRGGFPGLNDGARRRRRLIHAADDEVVLVAIAAAGDAVGGIGAAEAAAAASALEVADAEGRALVAVGRKRVAVAVGDGAGGIHDLAFQDAADDALIGGLGDGNAGRHAERGGEVGGVHRGDEDAALVDEILEVGDAGPAHSGAHVGGGIELAQAGGLGRVLPGQRI